MSAVFILYDILFVIAIFLFLPRYIAKKKFRLRAVLEKLFFIPSHLREKLEKTNGAIWIQAVSVGEVLLLKNFIKRLNVLLDADIVISTTTLTGFRVARKNYQNQATVIFFPFDISGVVKRALRLIRPKVFIAIETELWPNLFYRLHQNKVPILILNGRISDGAFRRYGKVRFFIKGILGFCRAIGVQNEFYRKRFLALGAEDAKITITGNMKFASVEVSDDEVIAFKKKYRHRLKQEHDILLIAASTHNSEEFTLLKAYKKLLVKYPRLKLILAPRHTERVPAVAKLIESEGLRPIRISELGDNFHQDSNEVFLLDTMGELIYFYSLCDIAFVGGSLIPHGGQNILEPAYFKKPIVFGPHMNNFQEIRDTFIHNRAAVEVANGQELEEILLRLIEDEEFSRTISLNAFRLLEEGKNYLEQDVELLLQCLK